MPQRINERTIEVLPESTYGTEPSWSSPLELTPTSETLDSLQPRFLDSKQYRLKGGDHPPVVGHVSGGDGAQIVAYAEGVRSSPADTVAAVNTAMTTLTGTAHDDTPLLQTSAKAAAGWTTTTGDADAAGTHTATGVTLGCFESNNTGEYYVRPCTYATPTFTLLMAMPAAPATADAIPAGVVCQYNHGAEATYSASIRGPANDQFQHANAQGVVSTMMTELEVDADEPARVTYDFRVSDAQRYPGADTASADDTLPQGVTFRDGEVLIAAYGTTAYYAIPTWRAMVKIGGTLARNPKADGGSPTQGVSRSGYAVEVELDIYHDVDPTDISTITATDWWSLIEANTENDFHLLICSSRTPGKILAHYLPRCVLKTRTGQPNGEIDGNRLMFRSSVKVSATEPPVVTGHF